MILWRRSGSSDKHLLWRYFCLWSSPGPCCEVIHNLRVSTAPLHNSRAFLEIYKPYTLSKEESVGLHIQSSFMEVKLLTYFSQEPCQHSAADTKIVDYSLYVSEKQKFYKSPGGWFSHQGWKQMFTFTRAPEAGSPARDENNCLHFTRAPEAGSPARDKNNCLKVTRKVIKHFLSCLAVSPPIVIIFYKQFSSPWVNTKWRHYFFIFPVASDWFSTKFDTLESVLMRILLKSCLSHKRYIIHSLQESSLVMASLPNILNNLVLPTSTVSALLPLTYQCSPST